MPGTDSDNSLTDRYHAYLEARNWVSDPAQTAAIAHLDELRTALIERHSRSRLSRWLSREPQGIRGLYLWGGVGRGKTFMMDLFAQSLGAVPYRRSHFHRFMYDVHDALGRIEHEDPLTSVASDIARNAQVLCFDEFYVSDIGDAMILGRLITLLIERNVTLVATSNIPPDELYADGLQRARFLPAIEVLNAHCHVMRVDADIDYRMRVLRDAPMFCWPNDTATRTQLQSRFDDLAQGQQIDEADILVNGRKIPVVAKAAGVVWFTFADICAGPRSQNDYIVLAKRVHTVLVSDIPALDDKQTNAVRRFIALVDEFYDRNVNLMLGADVALDSLYGGKKLAFAFERTSSRLTEMQSQQYLSRPHKP